MNTRQRISRAFDTVIQSVGFVAALITVIVSLLSGTVVLSILRANGISQVLGGVNILIPLIAIIAGVVLSLLVVFTISFIRKRAVQRRDEVTETEARISEIHISLAEALIKLKMLQDQIEELIRKNERLEEQAKFAKKQLEEEKRRQELAKQEQSIEWQKEALTLVDISPQAAMIIAWIGIEREIARAVKSIAGIVKEDFPKSIDSTGTRDFPTIIMLLTENKVIAPGSAKVLREMRDLRNQVAHDIEGEGVPKAVALDYVQKAIRIAEEISSSLKKLFPQPEQ